ncbi:opsin-5-like [Lingula anatina]|uniref:Opsin-5-like n=1 Tax=Lingula anatina TaxID=7574 RepID=A0A2R2MPM8_LINAN|nr:opsin-5-like [Lingula anatina]|eukprot:XP_023932190.1 opsin-5-like [Lingula anatina]
MIIALSSIDLSGPILGYPLAIYSSFTHRWQFETSGCVYYAFIVFFCGLSSIGLLVSLSVFRYIKVCLVTSPGFKFSTGQVFFAIGFTFLYSILWSALPLVGFGKYGPELHGTSCSVDWLSRSNHMVSYTICLAIFTFGLPVALIFYCYINIVLTTMKTRRNADNPLPTLADSHLTKKKKIEIYFQVVVLMCTGFLIAWTPYAVVSFWAVFGDALSIPYIVSALPALLAKASHAYNPIIYCAMNRKFQRMLFENWNARRASRQQTFANQTQGPRIVPLCAETSTVMHAISQQGETSAWDGELRTLRPVSSPIRLPGGPNNAIELQQYAWEKPVQPKMIPRSATVSL